MADHIHDKVIVIAGAASGFGRLVTGKTLARGARVIAGDINQPGLDALRDAVSATAQSLVTVPVDVTDRASMHALARRAIEAHGRIDVMINNAGVMPLAFFADHAAAADAWERCIDINFKGVLNGIAAVHDHMIAQGRGHIVNLSSIYGNFPVAGGGVYGATKAAVDFLSESLRVESRGRIKVTNVKPTGVPATGLGQGVVNPAAIAGILGANAPDYMGMFAAAAEGKLPAAARDPDNIAYWALDASYLADQIVYAIDQPWGVVISEITVRAAGDAYVI